jgi:glutathione S-transferase
MMRPTFYFHPLASFCWKALIPLYENGIDFDGVVVDLMDPKQTADFKAVWPMGKFPVLAHGGDVVAEASAIVTYLDAKLPGKVRFIPDALGWQVRMWDSVMDSYVHEQMQKIVIDSLRPEASRDAMGIEQARTQLGQSYDLLETRLAASEWLAGDAYTLADISASPALFYANTVEPFSATHERLTAFLGQLMRRPAFARVLEEAAPYFQFFPLNPKPSVTPPVFSGRNG